MIPVNSSNIYLTDLKFSFSDNTLFTEEVVLEMGLGSSELSVWEGQGRQGRRILSLRDK